MDVRPGMKLRSAVSDTEVVVVRAPASPVDLRCGGHPMVPADAAVAAAAGATVADDAGTVLGKRYVHDASGLEVLCTKAGAGELSVDGEPASVKSAKPLPSSD